MVAVRVYGLREFRTALLVLDREMPAVIDDAAHEAAEKVAAAARAHVPIGPGERGHARNTIKSERKGDGWFVSGGGASFPYYPWLDFGGSVNKHTSKPTRRAFFKKGRFIYPAYERQKSSIDNIMERALRSHARSAGLDVD